MFTKEQVEDFYQEFESLSEKSNSKLKHMFDNGMIKSKDGKIEKMAEKTGRSVFSLFVGGAVKKVHDEVFNAG